MKDAIIITISQAMLKEKGYRNWLTNFFEAMSKEDWLYYFRQGSQPKIKVMWVYVLIGGKIRFRVNLVETLPAQELTFSDGKRLHGRAWLVCAGPIVRPPRGVVYSRNGFQGFRYSEKLF